MKKIKNLCKRIFKAYVDGFIELYKPAIDAGVNPWL